METNLNIEEKDLKFIRDYLKEKDDPVPIEEISLNLAFYKTEKNRAQKVKIYSPGCEYKEGDLIYKEYPGKLPVGCVWIHNIADSVHPERIKHSHGLYKVGMKRP